MIKLKGWLTYNLGKGTHWIRFGNLLITYMHQKEIK